MKVKTDSDMAALEGMMHTKEFRLYLGLYLLGFTFWWASLYLLIGNGSVFDSLGVWLLGTVLVVWSISVTLLWILAKGVVIDFKLGILRREIDKVNEKIREKEVGEE